MTNEDTYHDEIDGGIPPGIISHNFRAVPVALQSLAWTTSWRTPPAKQFHAAHASSLLHYNLSHPGALILLELISRRDRYGSLVSLVARPGEQAETRRIYRLVSLGRWSALVCDARHR